MLAFSRWLAGEGLKVSVARLAALPTTLGQLLRAYGLHLHGVGRTRTEFVHVLNALQRLYPYLRGSLREPWDLVALWAWTEPVLHRTPVPLALCKALCVLGSLLGWFRWVAVIMMAFRGIMRPGEPLAATRRQVVLASDLLDDSRDLVYVSVPLPKTRRRGARVQHASCP